MQQNTTTNYSKKGTTTVRYEDGQKIISTCIWQGGPVHQHTEKQQELIGAIVAIRRQIRQQAEHKLIESVTCRMMERTRQTVHHLKTERAKQLDVHPKYIKEDVLLKRKGIMVVEM